MYPIRLFRFRPKPDKWIIIVKNIRPPAGFRAGEFLPCRTETLIYFGKSAKEALQQHCLKSPSQNRRRENTNSPDCRRIAGEYYCRIAAAVQIVNAACIVEAHSRLQPTDLIFTNDRLI